MDGCAKVSESLLSWYREAHRDLPWRRTRNPYLIWISEIMLQQTRVESVKGYYARFLEQFPTIDALAGAPQEQVLKAWEGLGYYSRARNLHKAAQVIVFEHGGVFPQDYEAILKLPGIGAYTAGAVASIAFGARVPAIDGNVYRVAARFLGIRENIAAPQVQKKLRQRVIDLLPEREVGDFNQALMELGATICVPRTPRCGDCPWQSRCDANAEGDAEFLPIHDKKSPPKRVEVAVCLLTYGNQILVMRRTQRLLQGLYVFYLLEGETETDMIQALLAEEGFPCEFIARLGTARHVFTHRVWEMEVLHFALTQRPDDVFLDGLHARLVDKEELLSLPLPVAMSAAKEAAGGLI